MARRKWRTTTYPDYGPRSVVAHHQLSYKGRSGEVWERADGSAKSDCMRRQLDWSDVRHAKAAIKAVLDLD